MERYRRARRILLFRAALFCLRAISFLGLQSITVFVAQASACVVCQNSTEHRLKPVLLVLLMQIAGGANASI